MKFDVDDHNFEFSGCYWCCTVYLCSQYNNTYPRSPWPLLMRPNYSFQRLDGAAKAHAFVKPILEDVEQWLAHGIPVATVGKFVILAMAISAWTIDIRHRGLLLQKLLMWLPHS
ncbi:MAG: hypothetical protein ACI9UN_002919 [Granulosicoccus sp.]|jgi:hypothetical protein